MSDSSLPAGRDASQDAARGGQPGAGSLLAERSGAERPGGDLVRTKIVATVGPACRGEDQLRGLIESGVDVFRLNMAHGSVPEHQETLDRIRRMSDAVARPVGVLVDLAGPKIRLGELPGGAVECVEGSLIRFVRGTESAVPDAFVTTYAPLVDELRVGDPVMLADGTITLVVEASRSGIVSCMLRCERAGVNVLRSKPSSTRS